MDPTPREVLKSVIGYGKVLGVKQAIRKNRKTSKMEQQGKEVKKVGVAEGTNTEDEEIEEGEKIQEEERKARRRKKDSQIFTGKKEH